MLKLSTILSCIAKAIIDDLARSMNSIQLDQLDSIMIATIENTYDITYQILVKDFRDIPAKIIYTYMIAERIK